MWEERPRWTSPSPFGSPPRRDARAFPDGPPRRRWQCLLAAAPAVSDTLAYPMAAIRFSAGNGSTLVDAQLVTSEAPYKD
jgi:hypothetical protein